MSEAPAPIGRRERRKREVHDRILAAAVALFEQRGFAATTAVEIAARADVAEKTFYNHFSSKQTLIEELARHSLGRLREMFERARAHPGSTADRLEDFFRRAAEDAEQGSPGVARELILELVRMSQVDGMDRERKRHLHDGFAALLRDGIERGDVDAGLDVDFFSELCVAAYTGIVMNWVSAPDYPLRARLLATARFLAAAIRELPTPADGVPAPPSLPEVRE